MRSMLAPALPVQTMDGEGDHQPVTRIGLGRLVAAGSDGEGILGAVKVAVAVRLARKRAELQMHVRHLVRAPAPAYLADGLASRDHLAHVHGDGLYVAVGTTAGESSILDNIHKDAVDGGVDNVTHNAVRN